MITVLTSPATSQLLADLADLYRRQGGEVTLTTMGGVDAVKAIRQGASHDVVVLADDTLRQLVEEGLAAAGSRLPLARSSMAAAVREGAPRPDLGTEAALRQAVLEYGVIGLSTGPSGRYLRRRFAEWGFTEADLRLVEAAPGVAVGSLVAGGQVALGFQQFSELLPVAGIQILQTLPDTVQTITTFSAGLTVAGGRSAAAREWLAFLASPEAAGCHARHGLEPASAD